MSRKHSLAQAYSLGVIVLLAQISGAAGSASAPPATPLPPPFQSLDATENTWLRVYAVFTSATSFDSDVLASPNSSEHLGS